MVIGKNIDKHTRWNLENDQIVETNVYEYLGVYFLRSLKFTYQFRNIHKGKCPEKTKLYEF